MIMINYLKFLIADISSSHVIGHNFMCQRSKHSGDESDTPYSISDAISDAISEQAEISYSIEEISFEITESLVIKKNIILISRLAGYESQELAQKLDLLIEDLQIFCKNHNEGSYMILQILI